MVFVFTLSTHEFIYALIFISVSAKKTVSTFFLDRFVAGFTMGSVQ